MKTFTMLLVVVGLLLASCGGKTRKKMSGEEAVEITDFISFFDEIQLPLTITDSLLKTKNTDSTLIGDSIVNQFVGDTIFKSVYGKVIPKAYAFGRFKNKDQETYLLLKTKGGPNALYALAFTPANKYTASLLLMTDAKKLTGADKVEIDPRLTFTLVDQYKDMGGTTNEFSRVYAYDDGRFMMILKNGLEKGEVLPILNPIDSFPAKNKYSGDYGKDSRNFISIRDGKTPKDFIFFLNMDKGQGSNCQGEIKGEASFVTKDSAVYNSKNDPCTLGFKFGSKSIRINESTVCGNQRPSECTFNVYYNLAKPEKPKSGKPSK